jgi:hypothetical protein
MRAGTRSYRSIVVSWRRLELAAHLGMKDPRTLGHYYSGYPERRRHKVSRQMPAAKIVLHGLGVLAIAVRWRL